MYKKIFFTVLIIMLLSQTGRAQKQINRDTILFAAREIINESVYCGLVTVDSTGQPQTRTMNPFPSNDEFITWFATSRSSRKVKEIRNNPRVSV